MSIAFISCIFGKEFNNIYPAPLQNHSYFFTNNTNIEEKIKNHGWKYLYVPFPISYQNNKNIQYSIQSKFVKFLQFLNHDNFKTLFSTYSYILYADHKRYIQKSHIDSYIELYKKNRLPIIISLHEKPNRTLEKEIEESILQLRYKENMPKTIELIKKYKIDYNTHICNTGIIFYSLLDMNYSIYEMLYNIYYTSHSLQQPQCQILWSIFSQQNKHMIYTIPFYQIDVLWEEPKNDVLWKQPKDDVISKDDGDDNNNYFIIFLLFLIFIILSIFYIKFLKEFITAKYKNKLISTE